jgi:hypothetical protein
VAKIHDSSQQGERKIKPDSHLGQQTGILKTTGLCFGGFRAWEIIRYEQPHIASIFDDANAL